MPIIPVSTFHPRLLHALGASVSEFGYHELALQRGEWETTPGMPDPAEVVSGD